MSRDIPVTIGPNLRALGLVHVICYLSLVKNYELSVFSPIDKISPQPLVHRGGVAADC